VRIYNPIKNSEEHDSEGIFIKKWVPELANIPPHLIHEPWKLGLMDQQLYGCEIGKDYPHPIVDIDATRKYASDSIWGFRKSKEVKEEGKRILKKHVSRAPILQSKIVQITHSDLAPESNPNKNLKKSV
jgi:deoxyribodipyrimidine photo-lyase